MTNRSTKCNVLFQVPCREMEYKQKGDTERGPMHVHCISTILLQTVKSKVGHYVANLNDPVNFRIFHCEAQ